jgi:hypothetical protein
MSPLASRFCASAEMASSRAACTSAWQDGQTRAPAGSVEPQVVQRVGSEEKLDGMKDGRISGPLV